MSDRSDEEIRLQLIKTRESEVICDQRGRPLGGVVGFAYHSEEDGDVSLMIKVRCDPAPWDAAGDLRAVHLK